MDMANRNDYSGTKELRSFRQLDLPGQLAVQLRASGKTYKQIAQELYAMYELKRSPESVREWFRPGGSLTASLDEFKHFIATESLRETLMVGERAVLPAVMTIVRLMDDENPRIKFMAAKFIIDNFMPDEPRPTRRSRRLEEELIDVPAELRGPLAEFKAQEVAKPVEDRDFNDDDWSGFLTALRRQVRRDVDRKYHHLSPK